MELYNYCVVYNSLRRQFLFSAIVGISLDIVKLFTGFPCIWYPVQDTILKTIIWPQIITEQKPEKAKLAVLYYLNHVNELN